MYPPQHQGCEGLQRIRLERAGVVYCRLRSGKDIWSCISLFACGLVDDWDTQRQEKCQVLPLRYVSQQIDTCECRPSMARAFSKMQFVDRPRLAPLYCTFSLWKHAGIKAVLASQYFVMPSGRLSHSVWVLGDFEELAGAGRHSVTLFSANGCRTQQTLLSLEQQWRLHCPTCSPLNNSALQ